MFRTVLLSIIRSFCTVHTAVLYVIQLASCQQNLYDTYHCCVYSVKTPDDGPKNGPKHV